VEQHKKQHINERAEILSKAGRGSTQFLASYRQARTEICKELSLEESRRYATLADKWNWAPVPLEVRRE
jgi:hypothetical protein